jgi:hypothetical protein
MLLLLLLLLLLLQQLRRTALALQNGRVLLEVAKLV